MKPLRILHAEAATGFGGQENRIFKVMCAMREHGHHLEAICQPRAQLTQRLRDAGFQVHALEMDGAVHYVRGVAHVCGILRRGRFDVVNTHSRRDTLLVGVAARLAHTPLIVRTRHLAVPPTSLLSYTVVPYRVIAISEYVRNILISHHLSADKVSAVYTPVPLAPRVEHSTLRDELGVPAHAVVVGCVAVMREKKGHRALIEAMADLLKRPDVYLVLVGDGSPLLENLQSYVRSLDLQDRVLFTGRRTDIPNVLAGFDIFALATEQEALGTVFIEAGAAGLPIVGTDVGGVSETFRRDEAGLLVPLGDGAALTRALTALIDDPVRRRLMGQAGIRDVRESGRFTSDEAVRRIEACYGAWLKERGL